MFCTYPDSVMPEAMETLGIMYVYAVECMHFAIDDFQKLFLDSGTAEAFAAGSADLICGMSGIELANYVLWASDLPQREIEVGYQTTADEYLAGRAVAQYQKISGWSFQEIHALLPMSRIVELVSLPEMDDHDMFLAIADELCKIGNPEVWKMIDEERMSA